MRKQGLVTIGNPTKARSKPQMGRRDFTLLLVGWVSTLGSLMAASAAAVRGLVPNLLDEPDLRYRAAKPSDYLDGEVSFLPDIRVFIQRKGNGYRAMSGVCTHLGCTVNSEPGGSGGFGCPCHGSVFDEDGRVLEGPAPKSLPFYEVTSARDGRLVIDRAQEISAERFLVLDTDKTRDPGGEPT